MTNKSYMTFHVFQSPATIRMNIEHLDIDKAMITESEE